MIDPSHGDDASVRPSIRTIARALGVSSATVSLALRGHSSISEATIERVREIARQLGYQSDPEVAQLMQHLRQRNKPGFQSIIAALTTNPEAAEHPYARAIRLGAEEKARELGYAFEVFRIADATGYNSRLHRTLRARGVKGILLLPLKEAASLQALLPWGEFSTVAATYAVLAPEVPKVVPDQFGNTLLICRHLAAAGCRRIGLVIHATLENVVAHRFSAAVMWQNTLGGTEFVEPVIHEEARRDGFAKWFKRERPDAIISGTLDDVRFIADALGLPLHGPVRFATTDVTTPGNVAGIDQRPGEIGAAAAGLLHARIQLGERGAERLPEITLVPGRWHAGRGGSGVKRRSPSVAAT